MNPPSVGSPHEAEKEVLSEVAFIESFNGKLRDELLNTELFDTLLEARMLIERWRIHYNNHRPHSSLGNLAPREFAESRQAIPDR